MSYTNISASGIFNSRDVDGMPSVGTISWDGLIYDCDGRKYTYLVPSTVKNHNLIPTKIIFNPPVTVCFFPDGSKVIARCGSDQTFDKETGVMACIAKKLFGTHNKFKKLVENGFEPKKKSE